MNTKENKIVSLDEIEAIANDLHAQGKKIVTTNGAFDLLHAGHTRALKQSKNLGDVLIVGLNSDASIKEYKSDLRPIIPEMERAEVLAALSSVDYVVMFNDADPRDFLEKVRPDIHTKGGTYQAEELKEFHLITQNGGRVVVTQSLPISTTGIIEKILKVYGSVQ